MEGKGYQAGDIKERGGLYFEKIQQGFSSCSFRTRKLGSVQAVEYLKLLWKRNGEEDSFVDFYFGGLKGEEKERVKKALSGEEAAYLEEIAGRFEEFPVFLRLDERLLPILAKLNEKEMLFSTFYFTKYPCTLWGNFNREYVEFYPRKRRLRAVVFDMDGLMFDTERVVKRSWDETGEKMGYGKMGDHIFHTLGMNLKRRGEYFRSVYGEEFPFETFTENYRAISRRILEEEGVPVKEGLYELLEYLKEKGYLCGVATSSSSRHAEENLRRSGVRQYFQVVVTGDQVTRSKPYPEIYENAFAALGVEAGETVVLEDSRNGLLAGIWAGAMAIMVPDLLKEAPDVEEYLEGKLGSLLEVKEKIEREYGI